MPTTIYKRRLPIPQEIREEMPLSPELVEAKKTFDAQVADVISGDNNKKLLVIGPCSADREDSVLEYVNRLAKVAEKVQDKLVIIPRVYTNKPRTKGTGYKGLLHQPDPEGGVDLLEGIKAIRPTTIVFCSTCLPTRRSVRVPSRTKITVRLPAASRFPWA